MNNHSLQHTEEEPTTTTTTTTTTSTSGVVWCSVVWCSVVWFSVMWCSVVWGSVLWCGVMRCSVMWCSVVWCSVVWCSVVWCSVVWCSVCLLLFQSSVTRKIASQLPLIRIWTVFILLTIHLFLPFTYKSYFDQMDFVSHHWKSHVCWSNPPSVGSAPSCGQTLLKPCLAASLSHPQPVNISTFNSRSRNLGCPQVAPA